MASQVRLTDGSWDWVQGVDSGKITTIVSELFPLGLKRNQLAWLTNGTVRGGGITQRMGWQPLCTVHDGSALYQGGWLYDNSLQAGNPYLVLSIGGILYQVRVDTDNSVVVMSTTPALANPALEPQSYFTQGEEFLIVQAGDGTTLPLFWDGTTLRRSTGYSYVAGVTAANFIVPAINDVHVDVTLATAWTGTETHQVVVIEQEYYMYVDYRHSCTLRNLDDPGTGNIYPAGTQVFDTLGNEIGRLLIAITTPAAPGDVAVPVWITPFPTAVTDVRIGGHNWRITVAPVVAAPAANHIYLMNLNAVSVPPVTITFPVDIYTVGELPAATCMDYYMGRIWYAQDRQYSAGDIVLGPAGTEPYRKRDSILKVTENPLALLGDGFVVPTSDGIIRALHHSANMDTGLGEGQLFVFTRRAIYSLNVPVTRADWLTSREPLQRTVQNRNGSYGDRCIANVNGDLFYQSHDGIRSLFVSQRSFSEWGNKPISSNINRLLNFNDRSLMRFCSGIYFDNRVLQTALPYETPVGVAFKGIAILDFDLISSLQEIVAPAWEGMWQGIDILQLFEGDFGGLQRAFAVVRSALDGSIMVWELTAANTRDNGDNRVQWQFETPAWTWGSEFTQKQLDGLEIWVDRVIGTVSMDVYYRPDSETCWQFWATTTFCSARTTCEDVVNPICYPDQWYNYGEGYKFPITFPTPPAPDCATNNARPMNRGYQFQLKFVIKGFCRIRGIMVFAIPVEKAPFQNMSCS